jgi:hypothetical protein
MQTYSQTFTGAAIWQLNVPGNYFTVLSCGSAVNVRLYRGGQKLAAGDMTALLAGLEVGPLVPAPGDSFSFDRIEIDVAAGDTVTVGIGNGQAHYNRSAGSVAITNTTGAFNHSVPVVTTASAGILAAKPARRYLLIQNKDAAGNVFVRLDSSSATAGTGVKIAPGGSYEVTGFCPSGAVSAIGDIASNANVVVVEG